jgi:hypothetical protein
MWVLNIMFRLRQHSDMNVASFTSMFWNIFCRTTPIVQIKAVDIYGFCTRQKTLKRRLAKKTARIQAVVNKNNQVEQGQKGREMNENKLPLPHSSNKPGPSSTNFKRSSEENLTVAKYSKSSSNNRIPVQKQKTSESGITSDGRNSKTGSGYKSSKSLSKRRNSGKASINRSPKRAKLDPGRKFDHNFKPKARTYKANLPKYFQRCKIPRENKSRVDIMNHSRLSAPSGRFDAAAMLYCNFLNRFHLCAERSENNTKDRWYTMVYFHIALKNLLK